MDKYKFLVSKLDNFINKYYKIQLLKGLIYALILLLSFFVIVLLLEYYIYFPSYIRLTFILFFLLYFGVIFVFFIGLPALKLFGFANRISYHFVSIKLKYLFTDINDSVQNILELNDLLVNKGSNSLIEASISQKIDHVKQYDFSSGLNYKSLRVLYPFFIGIVLIFTSLIFYNPLIIKDASNRIVHYNTVYKKPSDFSIQLSDTIFVNRNSDYLLKVKLSGINFPDQLFIRWGSVENILKKENDSLFSYQFKNLNNLFQFNLFSVNYSSKNYIFNIIDVPLLKHCSVNLHYPPYILKNDEYFEDIYDFNVPQGTEIQWNISSNYTNKVCMVLKDSVYNFAEKGGQHSLSSIFTSSFTYNINFSNSNFDTALIVDKLVNVVPDLYPTINVDYVVDDNILSVYHFKINIEDDYGFTKLNFCVDSSIISLPLSINLNQQELYFSFDFSSFNDSIISSYFKIFDNDAIEGSKFTLSNKIHYKKLNFKEQTLISNSAQKKLQDKLNKGIKLASSLSKEIKQIQKDLLNSKLGEWEKKEKINSLVQKQEDLEQLMLELSKEKMTNDKFNNANNEIPNDLLDKQEQLQNAFNDIMTDELKELFNELQKLQENFNDEKLNELSEKLDVNYDDLSKELDKNLEQLKRYEIENSINSLAQQLEYNLDKQKELSNLDSMQVKDFQDKFDYINSIYDSVLNENNALVKPMKLGSFSDDFKEISKSFDKLSNDINNKEEREKNEKQQKELAENINKSLKEGKSSSEGENADNLRLLLNNLFYFSFSQEELLISCKNVSTSNPKFISNQLDQLLLTNEFTIIRDSLYALSLRTLSLGSQISKSSFSINDKLANINDNFSNRNLAKVLVDQQIVIENANDMILLLTESLKNMDNMSGGEGSSSSKKKQKPKKGEPSISDMRKSQDQMKSDLEQMIKDLKNGEKNGQSPSKSQLGKMLARQEIFDKMLNQLANDASTGTKSSKILDDIKKLNDDNRRDIINMQINQQTILRQQQILSRLLEAENAELQRGKDEIREADENYKLMISDGKKYFEQSKEKTNFNEIMKLNNVQLNIFYHQLFNKYVNTININ